VRPVTFAEFQKTLFDYQDMYFICICTQWQLNGDCGGWLEEAQTYPIPINGHLDPTLAIQHFTFYKRSAPPSWKISGYVLDYCPQALKHKGKIELPKKIATPTNLAWRWSFRMGRTIGYNVMIEPSREWEWRSSKGHYGAHVISEEPFFLLNFE